MPNTLAAVAAALGTGLPVLLGHLAVTLILLVLGLAVYTRITPHDELGLIRQGNAAGGIGFAAAIVGLALPLGATLATSQSVIDIVMWGVVAIVLQLLAYFAAERLLRGLSEMIDNGNVAAATALAGIQLGVGILNAAAMAG